MINRYELDSIESYMARDEEGQWVYWDDYKELQSLVDRLCESIGVPVGDHDALEEYISNASEILAENRIRDRLDSIVKYISPENRPTMGQKKREKNSRHPMLPDFWWNSAFLEGYHFSGKTYEVEVGSYTGGGENSYVRVEIPKEWVSCTWEECKDLIDDNARQILDKESRQKKKDEIADANRKLKEAEAILRKYGHDTSAF